jgi:hypothetical protein
MEAERGNERQADTAKESDDRSRHTRGGGGGSRESTQCTPPKAGERGRVSAYLNLGRARGPSAETRQQFELCVGFTSQFAC